MTQGRRWIGAALAALALGACSEEDQPVRCAAPGETPALFVVNTLAETLTRYDIVSHTATCHTATLGPANANAVPNAAVVSGDRLFVVESGTNSVEVFALPGLSRLATVDLGAGSNPYGIALGDGAVFVTNWVAGDLARIDLATLGVTARSAAGTAPQGVAVAAGRVFVANTGYAGASGYLRGAVTVHDAVTAAAEETLYVGTNPQVVFADSTGTLNVLCTGDYVTSHGRVFFIDPAVPAVVDSLELGGSPGLATLAQSGKVYVTGYFDGLLLYDAVARSVLRGPASPVASGVGFSGMAFDPVEGRLYVASFEEDGVRVIDTTTEAQLAPFAAHDGPVACALYRP